MCPIVCESFVNKQIKRRLNKLCGFFFPSKSFSRVEPRGRRTEMLKRNMVSIIWKRTIKGVFIFIKIQMSEYENTSEWFKLIKMLSLNLNTE